jgi:uncharacterized coiled-coil protein SlyX
MSEKWHVTKEIPVWSIVTIIIQSVAFLIVGSWTVSKYDARLEALEEKSASIEVQLSEYRELNTRLTRIEVIVERIDRRLEREEDRHQ